MLIINTGGTFNKCYDPISGELRVSPDNTIVEAMCEALNIPFRIKGILYKDSLEMNDDDRAQLIVAIKQSPEMSIVIIHGTDTGCCRCKY